MASLDFKNEERIMKKSRQEHTGSNKIRHHSNQTVNENMSLAP